VADFFDFVFGAQRLAHLKTASMSFADLGKFFERGSLYFDEQGFTRMRGGQHRFYHINFDPLFPEADDGSWSINYDIAARMKEMGHKLDDANKIVHIQPVKDPTLRLGLNIISVCMRPT